MDMVGVIFLGKKFRVFTVRFYLKFVQLRLAWFVSLLFWCDSSSLYFVLLISFPYIKIQKYFLPERSTRKFLPYIKSPKR